MRNATYFSHTARFCTNWRAANLGRSRLLGGQGRLKSGCGQNCPPSKIRTARAATAAAQSAPRQDWSQYVRIAGHGSVPAIIAESKGSNVSGIEVDNDIPGRYESFLDPDAKLKAIREAAAAAHSLVKDHPD